MSEVQLTSVQLMNKKQNHFAAKSSLIAGLIFAIMFAISFVISKYGFEKMSDNEQNALIIIGTVSLIVSIFLSIYVSFRSIRASMFTLCLAIFLTAASFTIMFSSYFSILGNQLMFFSLAFTAIAMLITGLVGFTISAKSAFSIMRVLSVSIVIYLVVSLVGSLVLAFTYKGYEIWQIVVTALIGLIIIGSNVVTFNNLKNMDNFLNIESIDQQTYNKLLAFVSYGILISIINTFLLILRILSFFGDN